MVAPASPRPTTSPGRPDRPFTVEEACQYLSISRPKLYGLERTGQITFVRIGGRGTRVPAADVYRLAGIEVDR